MILKELVLQNFGPYRGRQTLPLLTSDRQPIILIGGLNGGGKTTLMDALRLVLYGARAQCSTRGNRAYHTFLNQCINRHATDAPTQLELTFLQTLNNEPQPTTFTLRRTWQTLPKNGRDTLEVCRNGELADDLTQGWDEHIEAILPLGISNLFLFDGEQVKELAEQEDLPASVIQAMRTLLGLELPDRLDADLDILLARKRKALAKDDDLKQIDAIESTLAQQIQERQSTLAAAAHLKPKLEAAQEALHLAEDKFIAEGGKIAAEKAQNELQQQQLQAALDTERQTLRDLAAGALPLALITDLLHPAHTQAQTEVRQQQCQTAKDLLQEQAQALLAFTQQQAFAPEQIDQIDRFLTQQLDTLVHSTTAPYLGTDTTHLHSLEQLLSHTLPHQQRLTQTHLKQIQTLQTRLESLIRYLSSAAAPEAYARLQDKVRTAQATVAQLKVEYEQAQHQHHRAKQAIERTKKDLEAYSQLAIDFKNTDHMIQAIGKVKDTLAEYKQRLKLQKLNKLEDLVTQHFGYLLRKSDLVKRVQIDTDTFRLSLYDANGDPIPKHRLSAGEKQILAIAFLWGLASASGRQLPVAIDTPLGRLDSEHRRHLVDRYFPQASHQVILLSTDTEIRTEEVERLREQGAIASEYLLHYDLKAKQTAVQEGYFW